MELGMPGQVAEKKIYDVAAKGDAIAFQELLHQDPLLLDRVSYSCSNKTPLHIATLQGNLAIVQEILKGNRQLAEELDSQNSLALHMASAKGYVEIANKLLSVAPDTCLSRDCQGRNPLHLAAMKGHVQVLELLVQMSPVAAIEKLDRGQTVLHLCVKHDQLDSLKVLVPNLRELVSAKDDDGETILHLAVRCRKLEIIKYLGTNTNIDKDSKNSKGKTPLAIFLEQSHPDTTTSEIREILLPKFINTQSPPVEWLSKVGDSIMVVAILIATMAFQAAVSPAGGVWQNDSPGHRAGEAVMAYKNPRYYKFFIRCNTAAFILSLSTILLLISGLPFNHRPLMWALLVIMWSSVTTIAMTYGASVRVVTPRQHLESLRDVNSIGIFVWCGVMGFLLVGNTLRLFNLWLKREGVILWRPETFGKRVEGKHDQDNGNREGV